MNANRSKPGGRAPVVIVTGAFGTLGRAVADACAAHGWRVARVDRSATPPEFTDVRSDIALCLGGVDVGAAEAARNAARQVQAHFGRIDALVNVAGGFRFETVEDADDASWDALIEMNLKTALNATRAALPWLRQSPAGRVVNVGAASALRGAVGVGAYAASKSAVHRFTETLADELASTPITVNAVLPTIIDTPANQAAMPDDDRRRWVVPAQVADLILFLLSAGAAGITGALIPVSKRAVPL